MTKKASLWVLAGFGMLVIAGCATDNNRNQDAEMSSLNSRMASLQGELSTKEQEILKLQSELADRRAELTEAEAQKRAMSEKLEDALSQLKAAKAQSSTKKTSSEESDLK